jgi:hypothetical protein
LGGEFEEDDNVVIILTINTMNLVVQRVISFIEKNFKGRIDDSDITKAKPSEKDKAMLSRGLAAYALTIATGIDIQKACDAITDGFEDNGLDAIYFDEEGKILWLVQSKYIMDGQGGIDNGDIEKYCKGIKRLMNGEFDKFNDKIEKRKDEILEILDDPDVKIQLLIAYTGKQLSEHNKNTIKELLEEQNDTDELLLFTDFNIDKAYKGLKYKMNSAPIEEDVVIFNWGYIEEPLKSYYGQMSGADLAGWWDKYGKRLFIENIRSVLDSSVNEEILNTIKNDPENFIYLNNGITILCESIKKKPIGGSDKSSGYFSCTGISVVNGAQTLGSIGSLHGSNINELNRTKVFVKFISLEGADKNIGTRITVATNTQNKIDKKDFVSINSEQQRIQIELQMEGITYHYKRSNDKIILDDTNYSLEEVAFSLAVQWHNVDYSTMVKKESGKLWADVSNVPYIDLFNSSLTAQKIIKVVKVFRLVSSKMNDLALQNTGRKRSIYKYGSSLATHIVCQKMPPALWSDTYGKDLVDIYYANQLSFLIDQVVLDLEKHIETEYPGSMIVYDVLRNYTKCRHLKSLMVI